MLVPESSRDVHSTYPDEAVLGLKLPLGGFIIIDQSKPCTSPSTNMCPKTESNNTVFISLVERGEFFGEICLRDIRTAGMQNVNDELAARQQTVGDELACP